MSTDFRAEGDELAFVRFCGRRAGEEIQGFRTCFEFGNISNFFRVMDMASNGETFIPQGDPLDGDPATEADFVEIFMNGRATFGQMSVTVEVGSGDLFRFAVDEFST